MSRFTTGAPGRPGGASRGGKTPKGFGKTPVVVENNWSWNIQHGIKGKTKRLHYKDEFGNEFDLTGTNANQGQFDWSDKTPVYFR